MFKNWVTKSQILGNLEIQTEQNLTQAVENMKFRYQKDTEIHSKQEILNKKWSWSQDNREILMDNFTPILKTKLDSEVITYKNALTDSFGEGFVNSLNKGYSELSQKRILKLSNLYSPVQ